MEKDTEYTEVIFRKWKNEIIALMPYIFDDYRALNCLSYMHVGQHSNANYIHIMYSSKPAKEEEYKDLLNELENIGYLVKPILKRNTLKWLHDRKNYLSQLEML